MGTQLGFAQKIGMYDHPSIGQFVWNDFFEKQELCNYEYLKNQPPKTIGFIKNQRATQHW